MENFIIIVSETPLYRGSGNLTETQGMHDAETAGLLEPQVSIA